MDELLSIILMIPIVLIATILHELSHGYVSYWLGDPTPKETGRLTLNPIKHIDLLGALSLIFFHVGWAKPVMINPSYYKRKKLSITLVGLAGPVMNFILAIINSLFAVLLYPKIGGEGIEAILLEVLYNFFVYSVIINVGFGIFNLIPIPPLDGSKVLGIIIPDHAYEKYMSYQRYGMFFLLGLIIIMDVLEYFGLPNLITEGINYISNFLFNLFFNLIY